MTLDSAATAGAPGAGGKAAIRAAASELFVRDGFGATGVRDIATHAGVSPALVIRHFGSKEALFLEVVSVSAFWAPLLDGPIDGLGTRIARSLAPSRVERLRVYGALVRASDLPGVRASMRAAMLTTFVEPVMARLDVPDAELRAHLLAAQVDGLLTALVIREDPVLLALEDDAFADRFGPLLQGALDG